MNILYCGDKGIAQGLLVSVLSLLKHNKGVLHFYILTINYEDTVAFTEKSAKFLDSLVKKTNAKSFVKLIDATDVFVKNLPKKNMGSYFTPCAMLRLYADKVSEIAKLERALYLDYDVVCRRDLAEFYNMDLTDIEAAGVLDIYGRRWYHYHGLFVQDYMNSGVMLFNMSECLKSHMFERAAALCAKRWMMLADQAALNKMITKRKLVDRKYNEQEERPREDTVLHHFSNNFKFWPYFHVQKVKPHEIDKIHDVLKITEYDDILNEFNKLKDNL
ncbi:glycosyltransferase family 8 protein [Candidatus Saccharibacteria bacterium]|nr:glycosyltransferase family 8 protein [Candidatus Saccharibacteria bacterium]